LWGHLAHEAMTRLTPGQHLEAGAVVGEMGVVAENGGWVPHSLCLQELVARIHRKQRLTHRSVRLR